MGKGKRRESDPELADDLAARSFETYFPDPFRVEDKWLRELWGEAFLEGVQDALHTLKVPDLVRGVAIHAGYQGFAIGYVVSQAWPTKEARAKRAQQIVEDPDDKTMDPFREGLREQLDTILQDDTGLKNAINFVRQTAVVRAWAGLEALAEDVWVGVLDIAPRRFRDACFERVVSRSDLGGDEVPGLGAKHISFGELRKYDFDVSNALGRLLARKCSFKTTEGIRRAYRAAFGWVDPTPDIRYFDRVTRVEIMRHCIVHRGGIIDEELVRRLPGEGFKIGARLEFSREEAAESIGLILEEGTQLTAAVLKMIMGARKGN